MDYKRLIFELVEKINNQRFLKAIFISLRDFLYETEKEEKPE